MFLQRSLGLQLFHTQLAVCRHANSIRFQLWLRSGSCHDRKCIDDMQNVKRKHQAIMAVQVALPAADGTCYDSVTQLKLFSHMAVLLSADATAAVVISPLTTLVVSADQYGITALVRCRPLSRTSARTRTCTPFTCTLC